MGEEGLLDRDAELVDGLAGSIEKEQKPGNLLAHGVFDGLGLAGVVTSKDELDSLGLGGDAAGAARAAQCCFDPGGAESCRGARGGCDAQKFPGFGAGEPVLPYRAGLKERRVELAQHGAELVGGLLTCPDRILLGTGPGR
ncbi:MAG: hypothetical protein JWO29_1482 [Arthrobacter sp.]|nr:hypothetical protein [Arthrobacter sp.]